eukprot:TRINITY_DN78037_c0_g1_i1.p1 TRINITY_DN78037_c0_g1~~TRINITY_DN78037_c0_g1_i1.p1  ORF type:complete len:337 (+),score=61.89 TRINITY_DN78037_c0_g1_i1:65-1075(+)
MALAAQCPSEAKVFATMAIKSPLALPSLSVRQSDTDCSELEDNSSVETCGSSQSQVRQQVAFDLPSVENVDIDADNQEKPMRSNETCLPGIMARRGLRGHRGGYAVEFAGEHDEIAIRESDVDAQMSLDSPDKTCDFPGLRGRSLALATPSSCRSCHFKAVLTPRTPDPPREDFHLITGEVRVIFFDFDGTLTTTPGGAALRCNKQADLCERAPFLTPHLQKLRDQNITLGVISKSSIVTVRSALQAAGLDTFFEDDLLIGKATSLEGKAGVIEDLLGSGAINPLGLEDSDKVLLVDDTVFELELASARGMQTYAAPVEGGLQASDFEAIFEGLSG